MVGRATRVPQWEVRVDGGHEQLLQLSEEWSAEVCACVPGLTPGFRPLPVVSAELSQTVWLVAVPLPLPVSDPPAT